MLNIAYLLAKIGADTAENEQHFRNFVTKFPSGRPLPPIEQLRPVDALRGAMEVGARAHKP